MLGAELREVGQTFPPMETNRGDFGGFHRCRESSVIKAFNGFVELSLTGLRVTPDVLGAGMA